MALAEETNFVIDDKDYAESFLLKYIYNESKRLSDLLHYAKAYHQEISSLDKYLGRIIYHNKLKTNFEYSTLQKILESRVTLLAGTIQSQMQYVQSKDGIGGNPLSIIISQINIDSFKDFLHKSNVQDIESIIDLITTIKIFTSKVFRDTNSEFIQAVSNTLNLISAVVKDDAAPLINTIRLGSKNDIDLITSIIYLKQRCNVLSFQLRLMGHISKDITIFHLHDFPPTEQHRKYLLHIVGGLGSIAGIMALRRFLFVIKDFLQDTPENVFRFIEQNADRTIIKEGK